MLDVDCFDSSILLHHSALCWSPPHYFLVKSTINNGFYWECQVIVQLCGGKPGAEGMIGSLSGHMLHASFLNYNNIQSLR